MSLTSRFFALVTSIVVRLIDWKQQFLEDEYRTAEEDLAYDIATKIGIKPQDVTISFNPCPDGSVVPTLTVRTTLSPSQMEQAYEVLDRISPGARNARSASGDPN